MSVCIVCQFNVCVVFWWQKNCEHILLWIANRSLEALNLQRGQKYSPNGHFGVKSHLDKWIFIVGHASVSMLFWISNRSLEGSQVTKKYTPNGHFGVKSESLSWGVHLSHLSTHLDMRVGLKQEYDSRFEKGVVVWLWQRTPIISIASKHFHKPWLFIHGFSIQNVWLICMLHI